MNDTSESSVSTEPKQSLGCLSAIILLTLFPIGSFLWLSRPQVVVVVNQTGVTLPPLLLTIEPKEYSFPSMVPGQMEKVTVFAPGNYYRFHIRHTKRWQQMALCRYHDSFAHPWKSTVLEVRITSATLNYPPLIAFKDRRSRDGENQFRDCMNSYRLPRKYSLELKGVLQHLQHPEPGIRILALDVLDLSSEYTSNTLPFMIQLFQKEPVTFVRIKAINTLAQFKSSSVLSLFLNALHDSSPNIRIAAVRYLAKWKRNSVTISNDIRIAIRQLLHDPEPLVRREAIVTLKSWNRIPVIQK